MSASPHPAPESAPHEVEAFKAAFRRLPSGVSVITARDTDRRPVGFTATSLASLAATPALATFNMARVSSAWHAMEHTDRVLIHLLGARNRPVAALMAADHAHRFEGDHWAPGPHELPLLRDVPAWLLCRIVGRHPYAANAVIVVQVEGGGLGEPDDALVYHERDYWRLREMS